MAESIFNLNKWRNKNMKAKELDSKDLKLGETKFSDLVPEKKSTNANLATQEQSRRGFDNDSDQEDLIIPRVKLLQPLSPEVQDDGSSLRAGNIINSLTKEIVSSKFVPIFKWKSWTRFIPREEGGGVAWSSTDPDDERVITESKWGENREKPLATTFLNFFSIFGDNFNQPVVISFSNTNYPAGRQLLSLAKFRNMDMFAYYYNLSTKKVEGDKGTYFIFEVSQKERVPEGLFAQYSRIYGQYAPVKSKVAEADQRTTQDFRDNEEYSPI